MSVVHRATAVPQAWNHLLCRLDLETEQHPGPQLRIGDARGKVQTMNESRYKCLESYISQLLMFFPVVKIGEVGIPRPGFELQP